MECKSRVLFLTNNEVTMDAYQALRLMENDIQMVQSRLSMELVEQLKPSFIVSYNYKYMITEDIINKLNGNIINLHISYLPYNRGAAPNFFSFYTDTPKGVSIHKISRDLDMGNLLLQKEVIMDEKEETFATSYTKLIQTANGLLLDHWNDLKMDRIKERIQEGTGSKHTLREFNSLREKYPFKWEDNIYSWKEKYKLNEIREGK